MKIRASAALLLLVTTVGLSGCAALYQPGQRLGPDKYETAGFYSRAELDALTEGDDEEREPRRRVNPNRAPVGLLDDREGERGH